MNVKPKPGKQTHTNDVLGQPGGNEEVVPPRSALGPMGEARLQGLSFPSPVGDGSRVDDNTIPDPIVHGLH
eukprot:4655455-Alexandrium_andersonii.AAC.1